MKKNDELVQVGHTTDGRIIVVGAPRDLVLTLHQAEILAELLTQNVREALEEKAAARK